MISIRRSSTFAFACALALAGLARAEYPDKTITFVVPFAAGSATDQLARALAQEVTNLTKAAVVVDDKAGASGFIGAEVVKKAAPDGYTVFITTNTTHAANEHLFKKLPYDPVKDFLPVTGLGKGGQIMIVGMNVPCEVGRLNSSRSRRRSPVRSRSGAAARLRASQARCSSRWQASTSCTFRTRAIPSRSTISSAGRST
jgi:hypothetical protein